MSKLHICLGDVCTAYYVHGKSLFVCEERVKESLENREGERRERKEEGVVRERGGNSRTKEAFRPSAGSGGERDRVINTCLPLLLFNSFGHFAFVVFWDFQQTKLIKKEGRTIDRTILNAPAEEN